MEVTRHFTASAYVVYNNKVLLHKHKKLDIWMGFGGHIDRDELPEEAAVRETKEESGLDVTIIPLDSVTSLPRDEAGTPCVQILQRPAHILLEEINQFHQHIDLIYYAQATTDVVTMEEGISEYRWFSIAELDASGDLQENVVAFAKEAIEKCKMRNDQMKN